MAQCHWDPETYPDIVAAEVPAYRELQARIAAATRGRPVDRALELGTGTGVTTQAVLDIHPGARVVGIDASEGMLAAAAERLDGRVELHVARLEDPLPEGPFDLVLSSLCVHHLYGPGKADLFRRIADVLALGGRFVMGDVVVPDDPLDVVTPLDDDIDHPDGVADQLGWLRDAGFEASAEWVAGDLAVLVADR
jgi:tRNA (cmo5U34)-methyltransferase